MTGEQHALGGLAAGCLAKELNARAMTLEINGKRLVDDLSLSLAPHTFTMIMGPNGAGKSLLLRLLHGLVNPTAGEVHWGGKRIDDATRRQQAMVFQKPVLLRRSVAANIDYVLGGKGVERRDKRNALLERVGLLDRERQPARLLSGGEQQRLALARAIATEPQVLFLDEPTASLDPASVAMIEEIVRQVHRRGTKVIFVTHDIGQARRLADDIVFLHRGRLAEQAPAAHFFDNPNSEAACAYLGGHIVL
jgi:tungstate transport system ATP-binding protein